jgi:hypothetical protein
MPLKQLVLSDPDGYTLCFPWPTDGRWDSGGQP